MTHSFLPSADPLSGGLSVFFPAYNDAPTIPALVHAAAAVLSPLTSNFEIIVVNDGSRDQTANVLLALQSELGPILKIVTHPVNRGYGAALRSGFAAARFPWVFYTDGDAQYDPSELALLLPLASPNTGLVNGFKLKRHDPAHRILIGRLYNAFVRALFSINLRDVDCDFRLIRRHLLPPGALRANGGSICLEIALLAEASGLAIAETPVHHYPRTHGRSQFFRLAPLFNTLRELSRLYLQRIFLPRFARLRLLPGPLAGASRAAEGD